MKASTSRAAVQNSSFLRVVQLHSTDYGGGAESIARLNHRALGQLGHSSRLIVGRRHGADEDIETLKQARGVPGLKRIVNRIESMTGLQYLYSPSFRHLVSSLPGEADVVHVHSLHGAGGWADLKGLSMLGKHVPVILSLHDGWLMTGHCLHGIECERWKVGCGRCPDLNRYPSVPKDGTAWNFRRKKRLFSKSRLVCIAPSNWVKEQARLSPILQLADIKVVPNSIDLNVFHGEGRAAAKVKFGLTPGSKCVLFAASHLNSMKGAGQLSEILRGIEKANEFTAILIGRDSEQFVSQFDGDCRAMGYLADPSQVAECYRVADVVIIPSRVESFGLVAAEAVACGAGVAAFHAGGLREVVASLHQVSVPDGDVSRMILAVESLLSAEEDRLTRVEIGQRYVRENFAPDVHARACVNVYREAIRTFGERAGTNA